MNLTFKKDSKQLGRKSIITFFVVGTDALSKRRFSLSCFFIQRGLLKIKAQSHVLPFFF